MKEIEQTINTTARIVVAVSEKRCGCYAHMFQAKYKMRPKGPIYNKHEDENPKHPQHKLRI